MLSLTPWVAHCSSRRCDRSGSGGDRWLSQAAGDPRVSFNLIDFYHNFSRLLGVDSYGLTPRQIAEITSRASSRF